MFSDPVSFNGGTRVEVVAVLANCGRDTDRARRALVTWIRHKQDKGRSTEHILSKLRDIESKFIKDTTLHSAFRDARAETFLPRAPDLPLPDTLRRSGTRLSDSAVSFVSSIQHNVGPGLISSPLAEHPTTQTSPMTSSSRLSRNSSQISEAHSVQSDATRRSLPAGVIRTLQSRSPRIQIPRDRVQQPGPSSPVTSSPEESGFHLKYRYKSTSIASSHQSRGPITPPSINFPDCLWSQISPPDKSPDPAGHLSFGQVYPIPPLPKQIPRTRSRISIRTSPPTSSEEESDFRPRHRSMSQSRRRTPPNSSPPNVPLPPVPFDDRGADSDAGMSTNSLQFDQPPTSPRSPISQASSVQRPLPIQPIPSPIPSLQDLEYTDSVADSVSQHGKESDGASSILKDVVRQDSPVIVLHDDHASPTGIGPPPPYIDQLDTYFPPDMPTIGDALDRAVKVCGDSPKVRLEVTKCIGFHHGYEPPYWQTRLQGCGLNVEAVKYLVDEMCKQVDWVASAGRMTR